MTNQPSPQPAPSASFLALDTTAGSISHKVFGYAGHAVSRRALPLPSIYIAAVAVTYVPLLIAALLGPHSLTEVTEAHRLPFLLDWNVVFMFLASFPSLVVLLVNDQQVFASSLNRVIGDGTLSITRVDADALCDHWFRRFRAINHIGQALGIAVGAMVAYINYAIYTPPAIGYWIAANDHLLLVGFVYLYCIFVFYFLVSVFILRGIAISRLLKDIVEHAELRMLPLHPDKSGGLQPIGHLGLRNQYLLTIFGLNIVILVAVSLHYLQVPSTLWGLIAAAIVAYLVFGPIVFLAPLLSFRAGMLNAKTKLMAVVAQRLRVELRRLHTQLESGPISKDDEELIDRLRKIGSVIDELPVWPFDAGTLRRFITAYVIPLISTVGYPAAKAVFEFAKGYFP
jgi:hypothetical protein